MDLSGYTLDHKQHGESDYEIPQCKHFMLPHTLILNFMPSKFDDSYKMYGGGRNQAGLLLLGNCTGQVLLHRNATTYKENNNPPVHNIVLMT